MAAFCKTVYINCELSKNINPEGWHNWNKSEAEATTFYAEYKNHGAGADTSRRVSWSHQLTNEQAAHYTLQYIFNGWDLTN